MGLTLREICVHSKDIGKIEVIPNLTYNFMNNAGKQNKIEGKTRQKHALKIKSH